MPYKHIELKIPKSLDKRIKLTYEDKRDIVEMYATGTISQRGLARHFNVSRRLIQFVLDPEKHKENLLRRKERGGSKQYYDKDKWKDQMKTHRHHKQELYLKGKLILSGEDDV